MWRLYEPKLDADADLSEAEWEPIYRAARSSKFPRHDMELLVLDKNTLCEKAVPNILVAIERVKDKVTIKEIEQCLDLSTWVVGLG
jgi:hypothetical protein